MMNRYRSFLDVVIFLGTVAGVVALDRSTKIFFSSFLDHGESLIVIPRVFHVTLVHNTGVAFGMFKDNGFVFLVVPVIALGLLMYNVYYYYKFGELDRSYIVAFSLILGGAIGNLIDRITLGHVIDFLDFRVWPVFNVADSAITLGAILILIKCLPSAQKELIRKHPHS
ncbi:MAG: signal peptidase II [Elusimicrobia bacterium]|nr:signal peptidase II [Elusimicrobiota bacterium]